jgi:hypothetical protein
MLVNWKKLEYTPLIETPDYIQCGSWIHFDFVFDIGTIGAISQRSAEKSVTSIVNSFRTF